MHPNVTPRCKKLFWSKVDQSGGPESCWPFGGYRDKDGYGQFHVNKHPMRAHRVAFALANGRFADPFTLHRCHNPACCNPAHLYEGTPAQNSRDMVDAGRSTKGDKNPSRQHPERMPRGDRHPMRMYPERRATGERNGARRHPERIPRGERSGHAKLTEHDVLRIREMAQSGMSLGAIAKHFPVSKTSIHAIVTRRTWRHI